MTRLKLDFDDAFVVTVMHQTGITTLVSIDHHFDSIPGLHRVEPSDAQSLL
jgi:predicted nucleic acid-binding protein